MTAPDPIDFLPLGTLPFNVLLALGGEAMHGYGIIQAHERHTEGRESLLPGSLYAALGRMVEQGLIEEVPEPPEASSGGPARRYYRATPLGAAVGRAEAERMERLVGIARRSFAVEGR